MINDYECSCANCIFHINERKLTNHEARLKKLEIDKFKDWGEQIANLQLGLNNVYEQFKEFQNEENIQTIHEIIERNDKSRSELKSLDALILNRMENLYGMQDDFEKQIKRLWDQNSETWDEIRKINKKY